MNKNLNMDCLRTFVTIVELGGYARAANEVGRSAAAVSLQMDRLQSQLGVPLFQKDGRNRTLTTEGIDFLEHARTILAQNDAALRLFDTENVAGSVRLGIVQDFAEDFFPEALGSFSEQFPSVRIDVLVDRSQVLLEQLNKGALDQVIAFSSTPSNDAVLLRKSQLIWVGKKGRTRANVDPLSLVMADGHCLFRTTALKALGDAGVPWEVRLASPSMACVAAAAEAGLGVTIRTVDVLQTKHRTLEQLTNLPALPAINLQLHSGDQELSAAAKKLGEYWINHLGQSGYSHQKLKTVA